MRRNFRGILCDGAGLLRLCVTVAYLLAASKSNAQERLTLSDAINRSLAHNFDIRVSRSVADLAAQNNTLGNAGAYPSVGIGAGLNGSLLNTKLEFQTGTIQNRTGAQSINYYIGPTLDYAIYQGGRVRLAKKQLDVQQQSAALQLEAQVQTTVGAVIREYAQIVYQHQQEIAVDTGLALARTRMFLSNARYESGLSSKTDFLQARVDYNARQSDSLESTARLAAAFGNLNVLIGEPEVNRTWLVDDTLITNPDLQPADSALLKRNPAIRLAAQVVENARLEARIARTFLLPSANINAGYGYSRTQNQAGQLLFNQSFGPTGGVGVNIPLYQGGNLRRQYRVATLQALQEELREARTTTDIARRYQTAWSNYQVAVAAYQLEEENIRYAEENLNIQRARLRVGIANTLEVREAENSYVQALVRRFTAAYNLKVNETTVLELENRLVD